MSNIDLSPMPSGGFIGQFKAMASPCAVLVDSPDQELAAHLTSLAEAEAIRIEHKFSRYRDDNLIHKINNSNGADVIVDQEFAQLLDFASAGFDASEGKFDITSGVLRQAWTFDGSGNLPEQSTIDQLMQHIGWQKVSWTKPFISLQPGMQIDFGGIGKEYAVDRTAAIISAETSVPVLINYGGDLISTQAPANGHWTVGIQAENTPDVAINLKQGAVATSGDTERYLINNHQRYSHVLDATTGWPAVNSPSTVTVAAANCVQAGILATLGMLQGEHAEQYLNELDVMHWIQR